MSSQKVNEKLQLSDNRNDDGYSLLIIIMVLSMLIFWVLLLMCIYCISSSSNNGETCSKDNLNIYGIFILIIWIIGIISSCIYNRGCRICGNKTIGKDNTFCNMYFDNRCNNCKQNYDVCNADAKL